MEDRGQKPEVRSQEDILLTSDLWLLTSGFQAFFLQVGPSLASIFSVMWPVPAALISAALSALSCVHDVHWAGTFASAKIASTGHSGTHASQSMQSTGSMYSIMSSM